MKNHKFIFIFTIIFLMFAVMVPSCFSVSIENATLSPDNDALSADVENLSIDDNQNVIGAGEENDVLKASNDYYFNASLENDDGDGSSEHPYKYLTAERIKANCNIHLADGEYQLDTEKTIERVNIIGSNPTKTILKYAGNAFTVNDILTLRNVTLTDISITNYATLNATNTIFSYGYAAAQDSYGNSFGGAIYTKYRDEYTSPKVTVINSTFENNFAIYGGAIFMDIGDLEITDSQFISNIAYEYGGAIACEYAGNVVISKTKFIKNNALNDAGGAIYIKSAKSFKATNMDIINSTATFGGAITTLNCDVNVNYLNVYNCSSTYDGGAIYHMYGKFTSTYSNYINNTARNGGALFIDNSTELYIRSSKFINDTASVTGGAVFSISNTLRSSLNMNTFKNNHALTNPNVYETSLLNLTVGNGNYTLFKINETDVLVIPSSYSLLDHNYVTPVKDQQAGGNCWAFTALAVIESCIKKATGLEYDFSEENMKNLMALYSDYGWKIDSNQGGYTNMPYGYLTSWLGPVNDTLDLYEDHSTLSPVLDSLLHVQNILFLKRNNATDNDAIKKAILKYGAVGTSMFYDSYYLNNGESYYTWVSTYSNHAVTIVGWDDNYSKLNFKFGSTIEGDGAWIVRNSWGTNFASNGYFYVSYYDSKLAEPGLNGAAYTIVLNDTIKLDKNYQYDIAGMTDYLYSDNPHVWYKNRFTSTDNEILAAVSTYFEKLTNWTLSVYVNDVLKTTKIGSSPAGYWTINLDDLIRLYKGDVFEIVFETVCDGLSAVPISEKNSLNKVIYQSGNSYVSYDGENWIDLFDYQNTYATHKYYTQTACIKAFTYLQVFNTTTYLDIVYNGYNPVNITATVIDQFGTLVNGTIRFNLSGKSYTENLINGKATFTYNFEKGINDISCEFNTKGFIPSYNKTTIEIHKKEIALSLNITKNINNVLVEVIADDNINENVVLYLNNIRYTLKLKNGKASKTLTNLANGNYQIKAELKSDVYEAENASATVVVNVKPATIASSNLTTFDFSGEVFSISLIDENGNPVGGKTVHFILNGNTVSNITDGDGVALMAINLESGDYTITTRFDGDEDYFGCENTNSIKIKTKTEISFEISIYQNDALINISLSKKINDNLTLSINGANQTVEIKNGKASVNLKSLPNNEYLLIADLDNEKYIYDGGIASFIINPKSTKIIAENATFCDDGQNYYKITLMDEYGELLSDKNVLIKLNGTNISECTDNGEISIPVTLLRGSYEIFIEFEGDCDYYASNAQANLLVVTNVDAHISVSTSLNNAIINVSFSKPINEEVIVSINEKNQSKLLVDGNLLISLSDLENALYNIEIKLANDGFNFTKVSDSFTIDVLKTQIFADDMTTTEFSGDNFTVKLADENNETLQNKMVHFELNNQSYSTYTDVNGIASLPLNLTGGKYSVKITYSNSSDRYFGFELTKEILVKINVGAEIHVNKVLNNVTVDLSFTKPINESVTVVVNGEYPLMVTNGTARLILNNLDNAKYNINVVLDSVKYAYDKISADFELNVKHTQIIADNITFYYQSGEFEILLVDEDGNPISNKSVLISVGDEKYLINTTSGGYAKINPKLSVGSYDVEVKYDGDNTHYPSSDVAKVNVLSSIVLPQNTFTFNSDYVAKMYGVMANQVVTVTIGGVKYTAKTDKNGQISLNLRLKVGKYTVSVLNPQTGEVKTQNIKVVSRLSANKNIVMYYGANKVYRLKVFGDYGNAEGEGKIVIFKVNGKSFKAKTNKKGFASLKIKLKPKTYVIKTTYKGFTVSNKIKVKPTLITKNKVVKKSKTIKYTAKLLNKKGKVLKGKKITFKIKNKKYVAKTNKKGIATIKIKNLKVGKYNVVAKYAKLQSKSKITIKK